MIWFDLVIFESFVQESWGEGRPTVLNCKKGLEVVFSIDRTLLVYI